MKVRETIASSQPAGALPAGFLQGAAHRKHVFGIAVLANDTWVPVQLTRGAAEKDPSAAGIPLGLCSLVRLRHPSDCRAWKFDTSPAIGNRLHAFTRSRLICRTRKLLSPAKCKRSPGRLSQFLPRLEFLETYDLLVDPLQGSRENLLAMERMLASPRSGLAAWLCLALADPTPLEGERTLLVTELPER